MRNTYQIALTLACSLLIGAANAQTFSIIKSFGILTNVAGANPQSQLVQAPDGTLFGTASGGEGNVAGTVFKIQPDGSGFAVLKYFTNSNEGANPSGNLALSGNVLYGTTVGGINPDNGNGIGTVFKINTDGTSYTVIKYFSGNGPGIDGESPQGGVTLAGGALYGTTYYGGNSGNGTVFKVNADGTGYTVLKHFADSDGRNPYAGLALSGGVLYGTTVWGGNPGLGTVFKLNTNGTGFTVLKNFTGFPASGANPYAGVTLSGSVLYGTTFEGGSVGNGTVFKINTDGTGFTVLNNFTNIAYAPSSGVTLSGSVLYGATQAGGAFNYGMLFEMNTDGTGFIALHDFTENGGYSSADLTLSGGVLYGTTLQGGPARYGTVFKINTDGTGHTVLKNFAPSDAEKPSRSRLTLSGSALYGTTRNGGPSDKGTVFKVNTDGTGYAVLKSFSALSAPVDGTNSDGASPSAGLVISGGVLYGTASGGGAFGQGTMFRMNTDGSGYTVLKDFTGDGGGGPQGELTLSSGVLYGTTSYEISSGNGTVFKVNTNGTGYTVLKTFSATGYDPSTGSYTNSDGARPRAGLTLSGSALFGTTPGGGISGNGTVFQVNTDGTGYTVLKSFNAATYDISTGTYTNEDGANPEAGLMLSGGVLYGTTYQGGASGGGTLFKMNTDGTGYAVLKHCTFGDGRFPLAGLTLVGGVLYGAMSSGGGSSGVGTVFKVNTDGTEYSLLKVFTNSPDGAYPGADLTYSGGVLYGTTGSGGEMGLGTVFKLQLPTALRGYLSIQPDGGGGMFITINGSPGLTYRLQRASALAGPWNTSAPQTAPASGLVEFHDLFPPPGQAFYRAVQP